MKVRISFRVIQEWRERSCHQIVLTYLKLGKDNLEGKRLPKVSFQRSLESNYNKILCKTDTELLDIYWLPTIKVMNLKSHEKWWFGECVHKYGVLYDLE